MTWIHAELVNDQGEKVIHVKMQSACCKLDLFYIEVSPNKFIYADSRLPIDDGMVRTIIDCRRNK